MRKASAVGFGKMSWNRRPFSSSALFASSWAGRRKDLQVAAVLVYEEDEIGQRAQDRAEAMLADRELRGAHRDQHLELAFALFHRAPPFGDVALDPEVAGDAPVSVVEADVVPFDEDRIAVEAAFLRFDMEAPAIEELPPHPARVAQVVREQLPRRDADELIAARPRTAAASRRWPWSRGGDRVRSRGALPCRRWSFHAIGSSSIMKKKPSSDCEKKSSRRSFVGSCAIVARGF